MEPLRIDLRQPPFAEPRVVNEGRGWTNADGTVARVRERDVEVIRHDRREWAAMSAILRAHPDIPPTAYPYMYDGRMYLAGLSLDTDDPFSASWLRTQFGGTLPLFIEEYAHLLLLHWCAGCDT